MLTFEDLLNPLSLDEFYDIYYKKRWCVIKGNDFRKDLFSKIITWQKFSRYINNDRAVSGLQAILPDGRKLCMEKWNLFKSKNLIGVRNIILRKNIYTIYGLITELLF